MPQQLRAKVDTDQPRAPMTWMQRLKRVFSIDIETCPECGGQLRIIACIEDPVVIAQLLGPVRARDENLSIEPRAPPGLVVPPSH